MNYLSLIILVGALSGETRPEATDYASIGLYTLMVFVVLGALMFLATWLGSRNPNPVKDSPYESGVDPAGSARLKFPVQFYLVAIFFIVFDLEAVFIYSWAVAANTLGWAGFAYITFFIAMLFAGLVYVWKKKGLEWGPK